MTMADTHTPDDSAATPGPPDDTLADGAWHRVHPLTPVMKSGAFLLVVLGIGISRAEDMLKEALNGAAGGSSSSSNAETYAASRWLVALAILVGVLAVLLLANWIMWRKNEFRVDDDSLQVRKGVVGKAHRKARLDRVQAIDLTQPLLPRLLGLAQLKFDVAGGSDSNLTIEYLRRADAEKLRATMLERVRVSRETSREGGTSRTSTSLGAGGQEAAANPGDAPEDEAHTTRQAARVREDAATARASRPGASLGSRLVHGVIPGVVDDLSGTLTEALAPYRVRVAADAEGAIVRVPPHRVFTAQALTGGALVAEAGFVVLLVLFGVGVSTGHASEAFSIALTVLFVMFGAVNAAVRAFLRDSNFSVALTSDGIVVTHGLTSTTRRVIPVDRIQAVELTQPVLWRRFGWWRVRMNLASSSVLGDDADAILLPVGSVDDAMMLMGLVLPEPGTPPDVAGRDLMLEAMMAERTTSTSADAAMFTGPGRRARLLDPLSSRREAWARTATMTVIREGRMKRRVVCVPHARVQSMALAQGPLQRWLGLGTVELHSTSGPTRPRLVHQDAEVAQRFLFDHAEVTRRARAALDAPDPQRADV